MAVCIAPVLRCVNTCLSWLEPRKYPVRTNLLDMMHVGANTAIFDIHPDPSRHGDTRKHTQLL